MSKHRVESRGLSAANHRRDFIGGSDARIIMGTDQAALLQLWREKRGEAEPEDLSGNLVVQLGRATEELNQRWYEVRVVRKSSMCRSTCTASGPALDGRDARRPHSIKRSGLREQIHAPLACGRLPSDPHHLRFAQSRALSRKVSDEFTVPLCRGHHHELHRSGDEAAWWSRFGIDVLEIARALWLESHPLPVTYTGVSERFASSAGHAATSLSTERQ
jgi:hypothetical protein